VLIAVLMVIVVLSLTAYRFADAMTSESQVAYRAAEAAQARAFAVSGVHYAMAALADPDTMSGTLGYNPYDNQGFFADVPTGPDDGNRGGGRFALVALADSTDGSGQSDPRYGVTDEGGKINLNAMMRIDPSGETLRGMLMLLPNMTADVADSIVDWLDSDDDARDNGAESSYYSGLSPPYQAKNGPLNSLDELLLVKGMTADLLYGTDRNRNGVQDPGETTTGTYTRGWADYLTVYGRELNVDSTGQPRVYINGNDLKTLNQQLVDPLGQMMADYVVAYRMYSRSSTTTSAPSGSVKGGANELRAAVDKSLGSSASSQRTIPNTILSLRGTRVTLPAAARDPDAPRNAPAPPTVTVDCPLNDDATFKSVLATLLDRTTAKSSYELNPRINVSTASQTLMACLPGLTADDVSAAVSARANLTPGSPEYTTGAWLVTQAGMKPELFTQLAAYVTGATMTYRVQSIGYFARGGPVGRVEAVIDTNNGQPRIVYFRDLTDLGAGFTPPRQQ
jgi:type II secretory pathway component PulK